MLLLLTFIASLITTSLAVTCLGIVAGPTKHLVSDCLSLADAIEEQHNVNPHHRRFIHDAVVPQDFPVPYSWHEPRAGRQTCNVFIDTPPGESSITTLKEVSMVVRQIVDTCMQPDLIKTGIDSIGTNENLFLFVHSTPEEGVHGDNKTIIKGVTGNGESIAYLNS